jgi:hypothetical protein
LHRLVARALLSPESGFELPAAAGLRSFDVNAAIAAISADLDARISALETEKEVRFLMRPSLVDPRACVVVVFVQDSSTREVLTARSLVVENRETKAGS